MNRRLVSILVSAALVASGLFAAAPAKAAPPVPENPNITDPLNDANFVNDQGFWISGVCDPSPCQGDHATPRDAGSVSDFLRVWFSNTADELSVHIQTEAPPPATTTILYRVFANADPGIPERFGCLRITAVIGGRFQGQNVSTFRGNDFAEVRDVCTKGVEPADGKTTIEALEDGTGVTTLTVPRIGSPFLADGATLTGPFAVSRIAAGADRSNWASAAQADNTKRGTDYTIQSGEAGEPAPPPPGEEQPPEEKKKCPKKKGKGKKGKGKGKKDCPKKEQPPEEAPPAPAACAPYAPGKEGTGAETTIVTDAATAEKPIEVPITTKPGVPEVEGHVYHNIQVDSAAAEAGLYAKLTFGLPRDYDLYLRNVEGKAVAQSAGYGPVHNPDTKKGGNSSASGTTGSEELVGIKTPDCQGYTLEIASYLSEGGRRTLQLWLGEPKYDPPSGAVAELVAGIL